MALVSSDGENIYSASAQASGRTDISVLLVPPGDRFLGLTPEARGVPLDVQAPLTLPSDKGIFVLQAPDKGLAYRNETEAGMRTATCTVRPN